MARTYEGSTTMKPILHRPVRTDHPSRKQLRTALDTGYNLGAGAHLLRDRIAGTGGSPPKV
jgi:hypothetical protein